MNTMKCGIRLPLNAFSATPNAGTQLYFTEFGGLDAFLQYASENLNAIEISGVDAGTNPELLIKAVSDCANRGLSVTIHGVLDRADAFFAPYKALFAENMQSLYNITVHPFSSMEETEAVLRDLCNEIDRNAYPIRITLENQRFSDESKRLNLCLHVGEIVEKINHPRLFNCFDFGHQLSNGTKQGEDFDPLTEPFLRQTKHTHIHAMY